MTSEERAGLWLELILDYVNKINRSLEAVDFTGFSESVELTDATAFRLMQIAELTGRLPEHVKERHPEIEWAKVRAFRNLVAHEYHRANLIEIFGIAKTAIHALHRVCIEELNALDNRRS